MDNEVRKKAFYEICEGEFCDQVQSLFEQAQLKAVDRGVAVTLGIKIHINAPKKEDPRFSNIAYELELKEPARKSIVFNTKLVDGYIVSDSKDIAGLNQLQLEFPNKNIKTVEGNKVDGNSGEIID